MFTATAVAFVMIEKNRGKNEGETGRGGFKVKIQVSIHALIFSCLLLFSSPPFSPSSLFQPMYTLHWLSGGPLYFKHTASSAGGNEEKRGIEKAARDKTE